MLDRIDFESHNCAKDVVEKLEAFISSSESTSEMLDRGSIANSVIKTIEEFRTNRCNHYKSFEEPQRIDLLNDDQLVISEFLITHKQLFVDAGVELLSDAVFEMLYIQDTNKQMRVQGVQDQTEKVNKLKANLLKMFEGVDKVAVFQKVDEKIRKSFEANVVRNSLFSCYIDDIFVTLDNTMQERFDSAGFDYAAFKGHECPPVKKTASDEEILEFLRSAVDEGEFNQQFENYGVSFESLLQCNTELEDVGKRSSMYIFLMKGIFKKLFDSINSQNIKEENGVEIDSIIKGLRNNTFFQRGFNVFNIVTFGYAKYSKANENQLKEFLNSFAKIIISLNSDDISQDLKLKSILTVASNKYACLEGAQVKLSEIVRGLESAKTIPHMLHDVKEGMVRSVIASQILGSGAGRLNVDGSDLHRRMLLNVISSMVGYLFNNNGVRRHEYDVHVQIAIRRVLQEKGYHLGITEGERQDIYADDILNKLHQIDKDFVEHLLRYTFSNVDVLSEMVERILLDLNLDEVFEKYIAFSEAGNTGDSKKIDAMSSFKFSTSRFKYTLDEFDLFDVKQNPVNKRELDEILEESAPHNIFMMLDDMYSILGVKPNAREILKDLVLLDLEKRGFYTLDEEKKKTIKTRLKIENVVFWDETLSYCTIEDDQALGSPEKLENAGYIKMEDAQGLDGSKYVYVPVHLDGDSQKKAKLSAVVNFCIYQKGAQAAAEEMVRLAQSEGISIFACITDVICSPKLDRQKEAFLDYLLKSNLIADLCNNRVSSEEIKNFISKLNDVNLDNSTKGYDLRIQCLKDLLHTIASPEVDAYVKRLSIPVQEFIEVLCFDTASRTIDLGNTSCIQDLASFKIAHSLYKLRKFMQNDELGFDYSNCANSTFFYFLKDLKGKENEMEITTSVVLGIYNIVKEIENEKYANKLVQRKLRSVVKNMCKAIDLSKVDALSALKILNIAITNSSKSAETNFSLCLFAGIVAEHFKSKGQVLNNTMNVARLLGTRFVFFDSFHHDNLIRFTERLQIKLNTRFNIKDLSNIIFNCFAKPEANILFDKLSYRLWFRNKEWYEGAKRVISCFVFDLAEIYWKGNSFTLLVLGLCMCSLASVIFITVFCLNPSYAVGVVLPTLLCMIGKIMLKGMMYGVFMVGSIAVSYALYDGFFCSYKESLFYTSDVKILDDIYNLVEEEIEAGVNNAGLEMQGLGI